LVRDRLGVTLPFLPRGRGRRFAWLRHGSPATVVVSHGAGLWEATVAAQLSMLNTINTNKCGGPARSQRHDAR
jgi:hypothetical protein